MASPGEELPLSNDSSSSMASMAENAQRRFMDSINSSPSLHYNSFKDFARDAVSQYKGYEDAFFLKFKEGFTSVRDSPLPAFGVAIAAGLLLMRGPRRILFRHTLGRLQSEEAQFIRAEKNVKELSLSVDLMKKESRKLLERTALAEKDMKYGHKELIKAGGQIQHLANSVYKVEAQAADLMDDLREIPGREALRLRAEVASIASLVKRKRAALGKRIVRISELGVPV